MADFDCEGPCAMCNNGSLDAALDDFAAAEQGACLLVAMGLPVVSVVAAVADYRRLAAPQLWEDVA